MITIYLSTTSPSSVVKAVRSSVQDAFMSHSVRIVRNDSKALSVSHKDAYVRAEAIHLVHGVLDSFK